MAAEIAVEVKFDSIRVTVGGVLHLHVTRSKLLGVQSWVKTEEARFFIEYTMVGGAICCDYDTREKWTSILEQLARVL